MAGSVKIAGEDYDVISDYAINASAWLTEAWEKLGRPTTPLSNSGERLTKAMIAVWEELYPEDSKDWYESRKEYKVNELTIKEQVQTESGRSLASYPFPIYQMMKKVFPDFKLSDRNNVMKLVSKFPIFQMANKI